MRKKHLRVIKEIQNSVPRELLMSLTKKEALGADIRTVFEKALKEPDSVVSPRQKRAIQAMLDSGKLDREVEVLDKEVETEIDNFIGAEIDKAVKMGRLPAEAPKLKSLQNKGTQYARRQEKRLRAEFGVEDDDVADAPQDDQADAQEHSTREADRRPVPIPRAARR